MLSAQGTRLAQGGDRGTWLRRERRAVMSLRRLALAVAPGTLSALILMAQQTGSGTVQGVARDATSAVVAGAKVTIRHTATATKNTTNTNDVGFFGFPPIIPGDYTITVEAAGMQAWEG